MDPRRPGATSRQHSGCVPWPGTSAPTFSGGTHPHFEGANPPPSGSGLDPIATVQTKLAALARQGTFFPWEVATSARRWCQARVGNVSLSDDFQGSLGMTGWICGAVFGPEALEAMGQAFDEAWAEIAGNFGASLVEVEAARLRLAEAVLTVAGDGSTDVVALKYAALRWLLMDHGLGIRSAA